MIFLLTRNFDIVFFYPRLGCDAFNIIRIRKVFYPEELEQISKEYVLKPRVCGSKKVVGIYFMERRLYENRYWRN